MIKEIDAKIIEEALYIEIGKCLTRVDACVNDLLKKALPYQNANAKWALEQILENNEYAEQTNSPACQDTGLAVFFVEIGQDVHINGSLQDALNSAVARSYRDNYFRASVADPLTRQNTKTNTPAIINYTLTSGAELKISFLAKGAGSENMSALYMLTPSKERQGIIDSIIDCVKRAGANPCPPIIIGVGIGGNLEKASIMSKHALLRKTGEPSSDVELAKLETDILSAVNELDIGVQGFKGATTALSVAVESFPTHIGMLPVAVNIQCHSVRHFEIIF